MMLWEECPGWNMSLCASMTRERFETEIRMEMLSNGGIRATGKILAVERAKTLIKSKEDGGLYLSTNGFFEGQH